MRSSLKLFRVMGISIEVHVTFLLFFLLLLLAGFANFIFFFIIFSIVLAHELCHSLAAIYSGIPVPRIILLPFGGLASIELPENPVTELKISLAGPLFNFFLAGVGFILVNALDLTLLSYGQLVEVLIYGDVGIFTAGYVLSMLVMGNLILGLFNMLPAFPMDGGRVFRSILALWVDYAKATEIAGRIGQTVFLFLIVAGFLTINFWWIIIGFFLLYASGSEVKFVLLKKTFGGLSMRDLVSHQGKLPVVDSSISFNDFLKVVAKPSQRFYLAVGGDGSLAGVLDLHQLNETVDLSRGVGVYAKAHYGMVNSSSSVSDSIKNVLSNEITLVTEGNMVLGYMTPELFMELTHFYKLKRRPSLGN